MVDWTGYLYDFHVVDKNRHLHRTPFREMATPRKIFDPPPLRYVYPSYGTRLTQLPE
jgi:hypothetical protein